MSENDFDWIFDFVLQFIESDKFDASVMDFIDEKCEAFDCDEENKLIYTEIHAEFREHMEVLISSNLGELGITAEIFFDACEKGRNSRDINKMVFEKLLAMDSFLTFKKLMVKRNMELQVEAMKSYQFYFQSPAKVAHMGDGASDDDEDVDYKKDFAVTGGHRLNYDEELEELSRQDEALDAEMQDMLQNSLLAMELRHREEELEIAELEKALAISLTLEEERLTLIRAELKGLDDEELATNTNSYREIAESKQSSHQSVSSHSHTPSPSKHEVNDDDYHNHHHHHPVAAANNYLSSKREHDEDDEKPIEKPSEEKVSRPKRIVNTAVPTSPVMSFPEPKPLKLRGLDGPKPLPSLKTLSVASGEYQEKLRQAESEIQRNRETLTEQRKNEKELRDKINPNEVDERAKHMQAQREKIIAVKKSEREHKVRIEEERLAKSRGELHSNVEDAVKSIAKFDAKSNQSSNDDDQQAKREKIRAALTRRLKMELIESDS